MKEINLIPLEVIIKNEFYNDELSNDDRSLFSFCYEMCKKLCFYIGEHINKKIFRVEIDHFFENFKDLHHSNNLEKIVYFDDIIFQSGLNFIENNFVREVVFNYLFSFHASLRRGKPTRVEAFAYFI